MTPDAPRPSVDRGLAAVLRVPGQPDVPLLALLRYAAADPFAVRMVLLLDGGEGPDSVEWVFARSLLTGGLTGPAGQGDVRVHAVARQVHVELSGAATVLLPLDGLVEFLAAAYDVVPTGSEEQVAAAALDAELAGLLG